MNETEVSLNRTDRLPAETPEGIQPDMKQEQVSLKTAWVRFWTRWTFRGRASRSEFWWMVLVFCLLNAAVSYLFFERIGSESRYMTLLLNGYSLFHLVTLMLWCCLAVRRLHDTNHSGTHLLCFLLLIPFPIPFIWLFGYDSLAAGAALVFSWWAIFFYALVLLWWSVRRSTPGTNRYGLVPNLKQVRQ